ncbi:hypothetical protein ACJX0J_029249, partial [Zea mays]
LLLVIVIYIDLLSHVDLDFLELNMLQLMFLNDEMIGWCHILEEGRLHHEIFNFNNHFAERSTQLLRCVACLDPNNSFANYDKDKLIQVSYHVVILTDRHTAFPL